MQVTQGSRSDAIMLEKWGQDPSFNSFQKVFGCQLLQHLQVIELPNSAFAYMLHGRPIRKTEIVGFVRNIVRKAKRVVIDVDDGSAVIHCLKFVDADDAPAYSELKLGDVVSVKGAIIQVETNYFPYGFALQIKKLDVLRDPNEEMFQWLAVMNLHEFEFPSTANTC
jgi:hypothetical protein